MKSNDKETLLCALGGLGEVGKNMYVVMHEDELFIIDCGVMFPEDNLMGIDYVLADFNQLKNMQDKIQGLIITHGHEDHIGGIPFLLQSINIPTIYTPKVAEKLILNKLSEKNIITRDLFNTKFDESKEKLETALLNQKLANEKIDVTLPATKIISFLLANFKAF